MIGIENFPQITPPTLEYPNGDIKNAPSGTPVNVVTNGDVQQFFRKLMRDAGLTPNGLRDNEVNGWQVLEALYKAGKPYDVYTVHLQQSGVNAPVELDLYRNELSGAIVWSRQGVGAYSGALVGAFPLGAVFVAIGTTSVGTAKVLLTRFDNDNLIMFTNNFSGTAIDGWTAQVEIRVYR